MSQFTKRSLREKRAPRNFDSDNEDQDQWGYSRPSYSREPKNPSQQLNSDAKLLVKFLTQINKSCREYQTHKKQVEAVKEPLPFKETKAKIIQKPPQIQKHKNQAPKESKGESSKKQRQHSNAKSQGNSMNAQVQPKPQSFLSKYKALNTDFANKMLNIQHSLSKNKQTPMNLANPSQQKNKIGAQTNSIGNSFKTTQGQGILKQSPKQTPHNLFFNANRQNDKRILEVEAALNIPKPTLSPDKVFKRSTFHIAIAYHIHIIQVKKRKGSANDFDPTYSAKKLKERTNQ